MKYMGDIAEDATIRGSFNTRDADGAPITLAGTPALSVYKNADTTESTAGVTLTVDFDSRTGHHIWTIDTSADAFYATGADYRVVLTAGTVSGTSVVGVEVGCFSIENRYAVAGSGLDAAGVRSAIGLASANLDTQLSTIDTVVDTILVDTNELQTNQGNWLTATGFSTHSAADVVTALGTGSTLTACLTATGFSTHDAAAVVTALGTGSTLTACLTATGFSTHSAADVLTALGTGTWATAIPWNAAWDAEVQSEVTDALVAYDPPTKAELDVAQSSIESACATADVSGLASQASVDVIDGIVDAILVDTGTTLPAAIDAIEAGSGLDAAGVREAVGLASANLDTQLSTIDGVVDDILTDTGTTLPATLETIANTVGTEAY